MKKVKFTPSPMCDYHTFSTLTPDKVYNVIQCISNTDKSLNMFIIKNDDNLIEEYYLTGAYGDVRFIDVTTKYRNRIINGILK